MRRLAALALLLAGCPGPGGGTPPDLALDPDAAVPDMGARPVPGRRLLAGSYILQGVTRDGWVIAYETAGAGFIAASLTPGGRSYTLVRRVEHVVVDGNAAFAWSAVDPGSGAGQLSVWTAAGSLQLLDARSPVRLAAASPDGAFVAYGAAAGPDGRTVELRVARADGTAARTVVLATSGPTTDCPPRLRFVDRHKLLFTRCAPPAGPGDASVPGGPDGGAPPIPRATIALYDPDSSLTTIVLAGAADFFALDGDGTRSLVAEADGRGVVVPLDGSGAPSIPLDGDVAEGLLAADGSRAVFRTRAGALRATPLAPAGPTVTLVPNGVSRLHALAPDGRAAIFSTAEDPASGYADLQLVSTGGPAAPVELAADRRGALFGDPFTADGRHVLWFTGATDAWTGALHAAPLAPFTDAHLGDDAWLVRAAHGTNIVFNEHYRPAAGRRGRADLRTVDVGDVARADPPALLVPGADADFFLSPTRDALVFSVSGTSAAGIYRLPL